MFRGRPAVEECHRGIPVERGLRTAWPELGTRDPGDGKFTFEVLSTLAREASDKSIVTTTV